MTLLLGRKGGAAAVRPMGEAQSTADVVGMVTAVQDSSYTDDSGDRYTSYSITVLTTAGEQATYPVDRRSFEEGDMVRIISDGGKIQVKGLTSARSPAGSALTARLGNRSLADSVEILDTHGDTTGLRVYPSRLAGVSLEEWDVRFYSTNAQGEIDRLVLRDVTGDMHTYGLMTSVEEISAGMTAMGTYTVDVNGTETTISSPNTLYNVKAGPCVIKGSLMGPDQMLNLTEVRLDSVSGNSAAVGSQTYPISEHISVYEYGTATTTSPASPGCPAGHIP